MIDCFQASHAELTWLNEREDKEAARDWADKNLKLTEIEQYYEVSFKRICVPKRSCKDAGKRTTFQDLKAHVDKIIPSFLY